MIRPQTCPVCKKVLDVTAGAASRFLPFCSERCQQIDMYRWSTGKYAIVEPLDPKQIGQDNELDAEPE
ncbi:MAG: DNA gyrase inhibitor YacG [Planctomycetaceae bacterium]